MSSSNSELGTVVVTGGASGLGAAVVAAVTQAGGRPVVLDKDAPRDGGDYEVADLGDSGAARAAIERIAERFGGIDGVVTSAGVDACGRLEDLSFEAWEQVIKVNLIGTAAVVKAALPYLVRTHGTIVTVGSTLGLRAVSDATAYCASKFGVVGFTRSLATETAGQVGVTLLIPGGMETPFFDGRTEQYKPPPDAKLNRPEDVARAVVFALTQPPGCEIREMVVTPSMESSWP